MNSTRSLVTAAAGLTLVLTAAPARALLGQVPQTSQDSANRPWVVDRGGTWGQPADTTTTTPASKTPSTPVPTPSTQASTQVAADSGYIREVASLNMAEVRLGTLAQQRASNSAVKQFARQMVNDHKNQGQQWTTLAAQNGLPASATLNPMQQSQLDSLSKLSRADFDRAYMSAMVADHQQALGTLQRISTYAQSAKVKGLAATGTQAVQQHLTQAQQLASQVGSTAVATNNGNQNNGQNNGNNGQNNGNNQNNKNSSADAKFARELAQDHMLQVGLAQMAQRQAKNKQVKEFAQKAASDFGKWEKRWTDIATKHGWQVSANLGPNHKEKIQKLEKASKNDFDQTYLDIVNEHLGSIVPYFQNEGRDAKSADIRSAVNEELPLVKNKLSTVKQLDNQVQASAKGKDKSVSSKD